MQSFLQIKELQMRGKEEMTVVALPPNWELVAEFNANLAFLKSKSVLEYQGQGLSSFTLRTIAALLRPDRQELDLQTKRCENCGAEAWLQNLKMHTDGIGMIIPNWRVVDIDNSDDWKRQR